MNCRRIFILFLILPMLILIIPGCTSTEETRPIISIDLEFSHAPKVGETAEVILRVTVNRPPGEILSHGRAWLEFSYVNTSGSYSESKQKKDISFKDVLTSGDMDWEGTLTSDAPLEFRTDIRFTEEGVWEITGFFKGDDWEHSTWDSIKLAVEHDRAGIYGSEAYAAGELEWMKDYSPAMGYSPDTPNSKWPLVATLDLSKPPLLGETIELTWSVASINDIEKVRVSTEFRVLKPGSTHSTKLTKESMLVEGNLKWEGALKKDVPFSSSAFIQFPEEGDWEIALHYNGGKASLSGGSNIFLNVTEERGRWGWAEPHASRKDAPPPTPAPMPTPNVR